MLSRSNRLLLAGAFALAALAAPAEAALSCTMQLPTLGNDTDPGYIPAGPRLVAAGDSSSYTYVVNSGTDALEFWVQTGPPAPGDGTGYFRKLDIALSGPSVTTFAAADALISGGNAQCKQTFERFANVATPATNVIISDAANSLTAASSGSTCYFNHLWTMAWETFRGSGVANCGFTISANESALTNGTYRNYKGRIHVQWQDNDLVGVNGSVTGMPRAAMSTWYDVIIQVQSEYNDTTNATSSTEDMYKDDFTVTGVTYEKSEAGVVKAHISYQLTTLFPYFAKLPIYAANANNFLVNDGSNTYAGKDLTDNTVYPGGVFSNLFTNNRDGYHTSGGTACDSIGEECRVEGVLTYTWTPTLSIAASCSISSETAYQFDFYLDCNSTYNGTQNFQCGNVTMRDALQLTNLGAFKFTGNIDFCKSAQTDFPISWTTQFDVLQTSRTIGQTVEANGVFTTNKQLDAVAIKEYRVARTGANGLSGYWSLWTAADPTALSGASTGTITTIGTNVNFVSDIDSADSGKQWTIRTSFTPNIRLRSSELSGFDSVDDSLDAMILLPNDRNKQLSYTITMLIRMYADQRQNFAGQRRRRLLYRDVEVQNIETASSIQDAELVTKPVAIRVPENIQVSSDGSVTVLSTSSSSLSPGAIAGIAVVAAVVAAALVALGVLLARRSKRNAEAKADAEAAAASADKMLAQAKLSKTTTSRVVA
ncbi:hypothetical protein DFJ74DRAFT_648191, partial [Hyaloraphidium curvatum]